MPFWEERTSSSGVLPNAARPRSERAGKGLQIRAANHDKNDSPTSDCQRVEYNFRGYAQNQLLDNYTNSRNLEPKNSISCSPSPAWVDTQQRSSRLQSPPREPRFDDRTYHPSTYRPSTDNYGLERHHNHESPRSRESYRDLSPSLNSFEYESHWPKRPKLSEFRGGEREDLEECSPSRLLQDLTYRGRPRSRTRTYNPPAPVSATSTNSGRHSNSRYHKSEQERALSVERRAAEAAEYLRTKQSTNTHPPPLATKNARALDREVLHPLVGISNLQADSPEHSSEPATLKSAESSTVPLKSPQVHSHPTATAGVTMTSEAPAQPSTQEAIHEDQAFLFYDEISNLASLKTFKAIAESSLRKSVSEYDKAKDKIFSRFPSTSEASAKTKDTSAGVVKDLNAKIAEKDAVLRDIGRKVPALLFGNNDSASSSQKRIDELEGKCEEYKSQYEGFKAQVQNQLQNQRKEIMSEIQKTLKLSMIEDSTRQIQNSNRISSLQDEVDSLKTAHAGLKGSQDDSQQKIVRLQQDIPPNLKKSLQVVGTLSVRMDANDSARRELRMSYEESTKVNRKQFEAQSSNINSIQEKVHEFTLGREDIVQRLKKLENVLPALDERLKEAERKSMSSTTQFHELEEKTIDRNADIEQKLTEIKQTCQDSLNSAVTATQGRDYLTELVESRLSALEARPQLDSFKDEKDSLMKDIMRDVEQLQTGTIELVGGLIENLQTQMSNTKQRVGILETSSSPANIDVSKTHDRISVLEDSRNSASKYLSEVKERLAALDKGLENSVTRVSSVHGSIELHQAEIQQLKEDISVARDSTGIITTQVIDSIRAQPHIFPYAFKTPQLLDCPRRLDEIFARVDQFSTRVGEVSTRIENVDFKADNLDQRMSNINTKDLAHFMISQIAEQYPSLRNAIDTNMLKLDLETLSKRISITEEAQAKASFLEGASLVYAPLRKDVDELLKKFAELKHTTMELKQGTQGEKKEVEKALSDIASEFASFQAEVEAVASDGSELKKETDIRLNALKDDHELTVAKIETQVETIWNKQGKSEVEIKSIKDNQGRTENDVEAVKIGQKRLEQEIEFIKGQKRPETQTPRNSIASPFDNKDFAPRTAVKSSTSQSNNTRQNSAHSDTGGKKRGKNGNSALLGSSKAEVSSNAVPTSRKKRKITGGHTPSFEISDSE